MLTIVNIEVTDRRDDRNYGNTLTSYTPHPTAVFIVIIVYY